ncbi:MAG TPA: hypothetical protein VFI25_16855 [Planctomycetota bacterium]|jgi:hypothetical protein|nr:hypothetical protein [Planctomycetota bacterium]
MKHVLRLGAFLLPLLPGCVGLVFDEQEIRLRFDPERDRLDALVVYRGLYVNEERSFLGDGPSLARKQLDRILEGHRSVALVLPFFLDFDEKEEPGDETTARLAAHLKANVVVENGRFFRDTEGRVCWWQLARRGGFTELLDVANEGLRRVLSDEKNGRVFRKGLRLTDEESGRLLRRALEAKEPFLLRRGSALAFRLPASLEGHRNMVRGLLEDLREEAVKDAKERDAARKAEEAGEAPVASRPSSRRLSEFEFGLRFFSGLELSLVRSGDWTELALGNPERVEQVLLAPRLGMYKENLAPLLAQREQAIHADVTDETILAEFRAFGAR